MSPASACASYCPTVAGVHPQPEGSHSRELQEGQGKRLTIHRPAALDSWPYPHPQEFPLEESLAQEYLCGEFPS